MTLIGLVIVLVILALLLWAIQQLPLDATIVKLIRVVVVCVAVLYVLSALFPGQMPWRIR